MRSPWALLCLFAIACGRVENFTDAAVQVEEPDAVPAIDATTRGVVTVQVLSENGDGTPGVGATVVFVDPDGRVVGSPVTDSKGQATAEVLPGAAVTVVVLTQGGARLTTVLSVAPGDVIRVGPKPSPTTTPTGTATISFTPQTSATGHNLVTPCVGENVSGTATSATVSYNSGCEHDTYDYAVVAYFSGFSTYATLRNQRRGNATVPNSWTQTPTMSAAYSAVPTEVIGVELERRLFHKGSFMIEHQGSATPASPGANVVLPIQEAILIGDQMRMTTTLRSSFAYGRYQRIQESLATGTSYGLKLSDEVLPWLYELKMDMATRTLTYRQEGTGAFGAFVAQIRYTRGEGDGQKLYDWTIVSPTSTGSLVFPDLPDTATDADLRPTDMFYPYPAGIHLVRVVGADYKVLRQGTAVELSQSPDYAVASPKLTVSTNSCFRGSCQ